MKILSTLIVSSKRFWRRHLWYIMHLPNLIKSSDLNRSWTLNLLSCFANIILEYFNGRIVIRNCANQMLNQESTTSNSLKKIFYQLKIFCRTYLLFNNSVSRRNLKSLSIKQTVSSYLMITFSIYLKGT